MNAETRFKQLSKIDKGLVEALIDQHDVAIVLAAVAEICSEKADHLRSNWQDDRSARAWERAATAIERVIGLNAIQAVR